MAYEMNTASTLPSIYSLQPFPHATTLFYNHESVLKDNTFIEKKPRALTDVYDG